MKKIILIIAVLLVVIVSCSKSGKENKKGKKLNSTAVKRPDVLKMSYEEYMKQRMADTRRDALPEDIVGQMEKAWKSEIYKLYNLLLGELSDKERERLRLDEKEWEKKINTESKEKRLEKTEKRAIEMARRYDRIRKKY